MNTRLTLTLCALCALAACKGREARLGVCMEARAAAGASWEQYNHTLRQAQQQTARNGGSLEVSPASPPRNPLALAIFGRSFEGMAGIATNELNAAKAATAQMWQDCRSLCEDMTCSGVVPAELEHDDR
jgi:hypothetical protein